MVFVVLDRVDYFVDDLWTRVHVAYVEDGTVFQHGLFEDCFDGFYRKTESFSNLSMGHPEIVVKKDFFASIP